MSLEGIFRWHHLVAFCYNIFRLLVDCSSLFQSCFALSASFVSNVLGNLEWRE